MLVSVVSDGCRERDERNGKKICNFGVIEEGCFYREERCRWESVDRETVKRNHKGSQI